MLELESPSNIEKDNCVHLMLVSIIVFGRQLYSSAFLSIKFPTDLALWPILNNDYALYSLF